MLPDEWCFGIQYIEQTEGDQRSQKAWAKIKKQKLHVFSHMQNLIYVRVCMCVCAWCVRVCACTCTRVCSHAEMQKGDHEKGGRDFKERKIK